MKQTPKQAAYLFFLRNAGFSYDPKTQTPQQGKAATARKLAKAERDARALGYTFEWDFDLDGCQGCDCTSQECVCSTGADHETLSCICRDSCGTVVQSLSSICEPSREYRRIVEAELAEEALASTLGDAWDVVDRKTKRENRRWIPKVGEIVTLAGGSRGREEALPTWTGKVETVSKEDCKPGTVYVKIEDHGWTTAHKDEITIH